MAAGITAITDWPKQKKARSFLRAFFNHDWLNGR